MKYMKKKVKDTFEMRKKNRKEEDNLELKHKEELKAIKIKQKLELEKVKKRQILEKKIMAEQHRRAENESEESILRFLEKFDDEAMEEENENN